MRNYARLKTQTCNSVFKNIYYYLDLDDMPLPSKSFEQRLGYHCYLTKPQQNYVSY